MPASIEGGWTTMRLENTGKEPHEFALAKLDGDRTRADVLAVLSDPATQEQGPPSWVSIRAGIPTLQAGDTASLTQRLEPGRYALICFLDGPSGKPHFADGMLSVVDVGEDAGAEAPEADATLTLGKSLQAPELEAGERTLELTNDSDEPNAVFLVSYLRALATAAAVAAVILDQMARGSVRAAGAAAPPARAAVSSGAASAPSSTVNEWPQPHDAEAFGLSILNPDSSRPFRKSIVAPLRYGAL